MSNSQAWTLYAATRDRVIALVESLTPEQAKLTVPLTDGWTIADVVAHTCGLNADIASGLREGLGTDERTTEQVSSRAEQSLATVCVEWLGHAEAVRRAIDEEDSLGVRVAADLVVHLHDIQHALDLPIDRGDDATVSGGRTYAARTPDRMAELASVNLVIELTDGSRFEPTVDPGDGAVKLVLRTTPYDFLRTVTGRRSRSEILALDWSGDPAPYLDQLSPYGPPRMVDAGV